MLEWEFRVQRAPSKLGLRDTSKAFDGYSERPRQSLLLAPSLSLSLSLGLFRPSSPSSFMSLHLAAHMKTQLAAGLTAEAFDTTYIYGSW